ncbi:GNAT family N-acetyltransferase [Actinokineospora globicatena]|uniref:N-acetyltransferase n=1 Tax=Actinokineospora globicatena TaxID=103729 RepID=A0A9W6QVK0_9PSEU|nr:GNAT family N-acetyltransferase [Actinokineospora globicatena]MCP2302053.1 Protein N-acetyltransferase, RimJ/RimL family [Actinokineospora globicatena]GLW76285.1 N-acetyltransferase [Actinokineospora globicatena]GLW83121.1 N-acetyltransferase [Actinokineospora globicatena]GLW95399.1 N-acetyltransferase [Actinokineospora globicatena]
MEPVEINAGAYYLRAMRDDSRINDRQRILEGFNDPEFVRWLPHIRIPDLAAAGDYIARRAADWAADRRYSWAVADPLTAVMLGEVLLKEVDLAAGTAEAGIWAHPDARGKGITTLALSAVLRFAFGGLGLTQITYQHSRGNTASGRVAAKLGFSTFRDHGLAVPADIVVLVARNAPGEPVVG